MDLPVKPPPMEVIGPISDPSGIVIESDVPSPKNYAHLGRRRRSYTDELFRCTLHIQISRHRTVCNHLLWRSKPDELLAHLREVHKIENVSDENLQSYFCGARKILLEPIPEDEEFDDGEDPDEDDTDADES